MTQCENTSFSFSKIYIENMILEKATKSNDISTKLVQRYGELLS